MIQPNSKLSPTAKLSFMRPNSKSQRLIDSIQSDSKSFPAHPLGPTYSVNTFPSSFFAFKSVDLSIFRWAQIWGALRKHFSIKYIVQHWKTFYYCDKLHDINLFVISSYLKWAHLTLALPHAWQQLIRGTQKPVACHELACPLGALSMTNWFDKGGGREGVDGINFDFYT